MCIDLSVTYTRVSCTSSFFFPTTCPQDGTSWHKTPNTQNGARWHTRAQEGPRRPVERKQDHTRHWDFRGHKRHWRQWARKDNEGHEGHVTYMNAEVQMPSLSTNGFAKNDNRIAYKEFGGDSMHKPTGNISKVCSLNGVYFIWLHVDSHLLTGPDIHQGFARPGMR